MESCPCEEQRLGDGGGDAGGVWQGAQGKGVDGSGLVGVSRSWYGPQVHLLRLIVQSQVHHKAVFLLVLIHFSRSSYSGSFFRSPNSCDRIFSSLSIVQQASPHAQNTEKFMYQTSALLIFGAGSLLVGGLYP